MSVKNQNVTEAKGWLPARSKSSAIPGSRTRRKASDKAPAVTGSTKRPRKHSILKKTASPGISRQKTIRKKKASATDLKVAGKRSHRSVLSSEGIPSLTLDHEEVARLAYFYWESRGCQGGTPEQDWYRAEEELRKRSAQ